MSEGPAIGPARASLAAHAYVVDLDAPTLAADDAHHLGRVLRLRPGIEITVADGAGRWRRARLTPTAVLEPAGEIVLDPAPEPAITIGFALVKGERPEWIVQKLTEVGVDAIVPFKAARSVVRWDPERAGRATERLRRVAREAGAQCRRSRLPVVHDLQPDVGAVVEGHIGVALASAAGGAPTLAYPTLLVGPEGGWSPEELAGRPQIALGPHVLRAETAAVVAGALMVGIRSHIVAAHER